MSWAKQFYSGNAMVLTIFKLSLAATIYWLWRERNSRVFQSRSQDCSSLQDAIVDDVRACISSWRGVKSSPQNHDLAASWEISRKIFLP
ncbi:hypothetical protein RHGRI_024489 [Rhododendron griersonianum]|uniref:RNA-directed DNA polymerase, eukaryota, Reverse transcriptase zinc-binding domain protein n=1 Tax=Rhododendron griersonianum TaxID=479676 RepID=A0AAV6JB52_9ERIC|nr:hypothetical protein RHGRI_024489 [Rhododendron griersonianum]